ncbi:MAG: hypothetical protein DHS20C12_18000 [Pseudohongiella sp.]|nr:MAG: hypothetical protein DHS20C12_18000 [Pseudohongiella sp.]
MGCINHPNAPAAATCKKCNSELCGICTRFLDSGEYCEKCAAIAEADSYKVSRASIEEARDLEMAKLTSARIDDEEIREKARGKDVFYVRAGGFVGVLMIFVSMGLYAYPNLMKSDEQITQEQAIISLEHCREIFQAIGIRLSEGEIPETTMSCPGTNIPNIITRRGNTVTVTHPNPRQFGLSAMYVTSNSHRVVME